MAIAVKQFDVQHEMLAFVGVRDVQRLSGTVVLQPVQFSSIIIIIIIIIIQGRYL